MIINKFNGFFDGILPDFRIEKRVEKVMNDMLTFGKAIVNQFSGSHSEKIGAYRMLGNQHFSYEHLLDGVIESCKKNQGFLHLLCLQDTTELNYSHHKQRIDLNDNDIGPITKKGNVGFFCHPVLAIDEKTGLPIGIPYSKLWNRRWDKKDKYERKYSSQDFKDKESYRWVESAEKTKSALSETPQLTIIGDRESDIYEELVCVPDERTDLLIRSSINRNLYNSDTKLFETLEQQEQKIIFNLEIKGNKKRKNRDAKIALKYVKVKIKKPYRKEKNNLPEYVELWAIEARELDESVPEGESPILWRLLTTHNISAAQDALTYTQWYSNRWLIEELFRVLKSQGLELESAQLESGAALKKLTVMALQVALVIMVLKLSLKNEHDAKAKLYFTDNQIIFLKMMLSEVEGKTLKQKNPYKQETLAWASWIIARLSGWSGYKSHGPPGYISIKRGYDNFNQKYEGFKIAFDLFKKDVYKE